MIWLCRKGIVSDETMSKNDLPVTFFTEAQRDINKIDRILANHGHAVWLPPYVRPNLQSLHEPQLKRLVHENITASMHLQKLLQVTKSLVWLVTKDD